MIIQFLPFYLELFPEGKKTMQHKSGNHDTPHQQRTNPQTPQLSKMYFLYNKDIFPLTVYITLHFFNQNFKCATICFLFGQHFVMGPMNVSRKKIKFREIKTNIFYEYHSLVKGTEKHSSKLPLHTKQSGPKLLHGIKNILSKTS